MFNALDRIAFLGLAAAGMLVTGVPPAGAAPATGKALSEAAPRWELTGSRIIACCCGSPCPCRINQPPMSCHGCDFTTAVKIDRGYLGKTRMDGVAFTIVGRGFGQEKAANWVYVYVSDKARPEQVQALGAMLEAGGKSLGSKAEYIAGKFLGMRQVPMTYTIFADRREYNVSIPGILELKTRSIILPGRTKPVTSEGIFDDYGDRFVHAECLAHTYNDPQIRREWDLTGRQSNQADFTLTSDRVAKGDIGWACWSAHAELGSRAKYQEQLVGEEHGLKARAKHLGPLMRE
jgi:hypothetical protein